MTPQQIDRVVKTVTNAAGEYPLIFIELMVRRALSGPAGEAAVGQFAQACRDMAGWYAAQADALEAEGRRQGLNVVPLKSPEAGR